MATNDAALIVGKLMELGYRLDDIHYGLTPNDDGILINSDANPIDIFEILRTGRAPVRIRSDLDVFMEFYEDGGPKPKYRLYLSLFENNIYTMGFYGDVDPRVTQLYPHISLKNY